LNASTGFPTSPQGNREQDDLTKETRLDGGCLCGHIRFRAIGTPGKPHTCSCHICQRHSGAPTLSWVEYRADNVAWTGPGGAPSTWRSSDWSSRAFCPRCGSTLGAIDDAPTIALVTGTIDRPNLRVLAPVSHSYKGSRPRWWHFDISTPTS
jgi:hypothetical protein